MIEKHILIANDIESKADEIEQCLLNGGLEFNIKIKKTYSYKDTLKELSYKQINFLILDMTMPTFFHKYKFSSEAGSFRSLAGLDILERMFIEKMNIHTILLTGFGEFKNKYNHTIVIDDLKNEILRYDFCLGLIRDHGDKLWQNEILTKLKNFEWGQQ